MKPVCVPCQRFYRPKKNGLYFIEGMPVGNDAPPGTERPEAWQPYKLWSGDEWQCRGCGSTIIVGCGLRPVAEHYDPDFAYRVMTLNATFQVNDC
jgi:hypothetical protein